MGTNITLKNLHEISKTRQTKYLLIYIIPKAKYKIEWYDDVMNKS